MRTLIRRLSHGFLSLALLALAPLAPLAAGGEAPPRFTAAQFHEDLAFIREKIARMHPDPAFSVDPQAMHAALDRAGRDLPATLSRDEAWQRLAELNPVFADAHFFVGYHDWRADTRAWLAGGGSLFPFEVEIRPDGRLAAAGATALAGARILAVNGIDAATLVAALMARVHGDTPAFRAHLLARRWWLYYWKTFGAPEHYRLEVEQDGRRRTLELAGSRTLPALMREEARTPFRLTAAPGGVAVLAIDTFSQPDPVAFLAFTADAFARIRQDRVGTLVIDISRNPGGDDGMWLDGLMPYLATKPYRTGSSNRGFMRSSPDRVSHGEIATWRQPQPDNPLRFSGKVFVRIGPATYSSAVLFANVMHDFGFGTLVGTGGAARRSQSGGIRDVTLPHTGLVLTLPRFILDPPAGPAPGALLEAQAPPQALLPAFAQADAVDR
jgi:hypothetical protein